MGCGCNKKKDSKQNKELIDRVKKNVETNTKSTSLSKDSKNYSAKNLPLISLKNKNNLKK